MELSLLVQPELRFSNHYELGRIMWKGSFSVFRKCVKKDTGLELLAKVINYEEFSGEDFHKLETDYRMLTKLQHRNIVKLYAYMLESMCLYFIFEWLTGGDLIDNIAEQDSYSEADASHIMQQVLEAVKYCHQNSIIHRDLKPENFLLASKEKGAAVKLANFELAIQVQGDRPRMHGFAGTDAYLSPEMLKNKPYGKPIDIWACGNILYLLLVGYLPFFDESAHKMYSQIKKGEYEFKCPEWASVTQEAKDLINKMFVMNHRTRVKAADALKHPWICHREGLASSDHRQETVDRLKQFNAKLKFKGAALATVAARHFANAKHNEGEEFQVETSPDTPTTSADSNIQGDRVNAGSDTVVINVTGPTNKCWIIPVVPGKYSVRIKHGDHVVEYSFKQK